MRERNRGARRDRDRNKKAVALRALRLYLEGEGYENYLKFPRSYHAPTWYEQCKRKERLYFRNQGHMAIHRSCGDCWKGGKCDWCYGGTLRKQQRLHDSLDADFRAWKFSEDAGISPFPQE